MTFYVNFTESVLSLNPNRFRNHIHRNSSRQGSSLKSSPLSSLKSPRKRLLQNRRLRKSLLSYALVYFDALL
ncbi:hypothetical protein F2Q70_00004084 [Brassica cretica]|uniref:Uncharacterized protein n=1 Tax=Brassica cretica TaxID=69181 RepID=A0A3N6Q384_BRACR|nr:hypothetical protein F2Q70_00004084 [Brassica cretica]KAF3564660.1 hypothetical protein DY000_02016026 [Brassica cretica]